MADDCTCTHDPRYGEHYTCDPCADIQDQQRYVLYGEHSKEGPNYCSCEDERPDPDTCWVSYHDEGLCYEGDLDIVCDCPGNCDRSYVMLNLR